MPVTTGLLGCLGLSSVAPLVVLHMLLRAPLAATWRFGLKGNSPMHHVAQPPSSCHISSSPCHIGV